MDRNLFPSLLLIVTAAAMLAPLSRAETVTPLHDGWHLQSSCKLNATGQKISSPRLSTKGWIATTVPNTVVAA